MQQFDVDYFIKKFEAIPEEEIGAGGVEPHHCALWHCGMREHPTVAYSTTEAQELASILHPIAARHVLLFTDFFASVWIINDDRLNIVIDGETPKQRILNALYKIKNANN